MPPQINKRARDKKDESMVYQDLKILIPTMPFNTSLEL
jgi:hypothetical protein